ncbi:MAG TPA: tetratricopeptide repeat protein [Xanthobacteraceae bacterium]|nr:tetratricopeptide repeat protein [Xanthobacteraceae bacterium]
MSAPTTEELTQQGLAHHRAGDLARAEKLYRAVLERNPADLNALQLLAALTHATGRTQQAILLFERAVATIEATGGGEAKHAALFNNLGNALRDARRGHDAVAVFRRGIALDPRLPELHANLANELHAQNDFAGAAASFEQAVALAPDNRNFALSLANAHAAVGRHDDAIARLQALLQVAPADVDAIRVDTLGALGRVLASAGRLDEAIASFRAAVAADPASCPARLNLAAALVLAGQMETAAEILSALARERPDDPAVQWDLAVALHGLNRPEPALAALARLLALRPNDASALLLMAMIHHAAGNLNEALASCTAALRANPALNEALLRLAVILADLGRHEQAIEASRQLLAVDPDNAAALCVLGGSLARTHQGPAALDAYTRCLRVKPDYLPARYLLGLLLKDMGQPALAESALRAALELAPDHVGAHIELGNVLQALGRAEESRQSYARAQALRPLNKLPTTTAEPDFAVLVIMAPGAGNTPYRYLIGKNSYECNLYALLPNVEPDLELLRASGDIVLNLISDADQGRDMLATAAALVDRIGRPVINHPGRIMCTSRDAIARLPAIARCRIPRTLRCPAAALGGVAGRIGLPLLLRTPGTHGGDAFEKIDTPAEIDAFVKQYPADEYYVTEFVDYRATDGLYRKYRMILVDGVLLPYHLAIHDHWKIHHFRTVMDQNRWMQDEEAAFLDNPGAVFAEPHQAALHEIARILGLEFVGVDCSIDPAGNVLIFEVNASMLIHDDNADYAYKAPHVARIKATFDAMLARHALAARLAAAHGTANPPRAAAAG